MSGPYRSQLPMQEAGTPIPYEQRVQANKGPSRRTYKNHARRNEAAVDVGALLMSIAAAVTGGFVAYKAYQYYQTTYAHGKTATSSSNSSSTSAVPPTKSVSGKSTSATPRDADIPTFLQRYTKQTLHTDISADTARQRIDQAREAGSKAFEYRCIKQNRFAVVRIHESPYYQRLKDNKMSDKFNGRSFSGLNILDVGCCMGTDLRAMTLDGAKPENIFGVDLNQEYIDIGCDILFCDRSLMSDKFAKVDILQLNLMQQSPTFAERVTKGFDVVYCGSVYHLLDLEQQKKLTHVTGLILNANPRKTGGLFIGRTVGSVESEPFNRATNAESQLRYMHTAASLTAMLKAERFVDIEVIAKPVDMSVAEDNNGKTGMITFCARRPYTDD